MQSAICRVELSSVACLAVTRYSTRSHQPYDFLKKNILFNVKYVFWFPLRHVSQILIIRTIQRDTVISLHTFSRTVSVSHVTFWLNVTIPDLFLKNTQIQNFIKIRPVGAELLHADKRTDRQALRDKRTFKKWDMIKPIVVFRNFANAPKKQ